MSELDTQKIFERLENLQKQNHNMKIAVGLVALLILIGLLSWAMLDGVQKVQAQETQEVRKKEFIQSEGFVLVDSDGNCRARLVMEAGIPSLTFLSADGKVASRLAVGDRPDYVRSWPEEKRMRLVPPNGLFFYDAEGAPRTSVQLRNGLSVYDETGQFEARMSSHGVNLSDGENKIRVSLESHNGLRLYSDGKETASLQACNGLRLYDSRGSGRVTLQPWMGLRLHGSGRGGRRTLSISCYDEADRCRLRLDGNNGLILYDAQGKPKNHTGPAQTNDQ